MSSLVVAIEGPSDSGKSTLIAGLLQRFASQEPLLFPCYVDLAGGDDAVPAYTTHPGEQLEAVDFYLDLERKRKQSLDEVDPEPSLVLLDRSLFTLLAHSYAVEVVHGRGVFEQSKARVTTAVAVIMPQLVLYLDVDPEVRQERADPQDRDKWFTNRQFNEEIRAFFDGPFRDCSKAELTVLNGTPASTAVLDQASETITGRLL